MLIMKFNNDTHVLINCWHVKNAVDTPAGKARPAEQPGAACVCVQPSVACAICLLVCDLIGCSVVCAAQLAVCSWRSRIDCAQSFCRSQTFVPCVAATHFTQWFYGILEETKMEQDINTWLAKDDLVVVGTDSALVSYGDELSQRSQVAHARRCARKLILL
jgi:hypothetical protein